MPETSHVPLIHPASESPRDAALIGTDRACGTRSDARAPVSVVIPVLNEEQNLSACLESVAWADEVFVVDSRSHDRTAVLAEDWGARVVEFQFQPGGPRKKNWALANLPFRNEWILLLDADERITPALRDEIEQVLVEVPRHAGYYLNRKQIFLGRWLRHGGNYPSWNLRLLRRGAGRYETLATEDLASAGDVEVHEHIVIEGTAGYLREPMLHTDFKDLHHFIERHNRYSTWDARLRRHLRDGQEFSVAIPGRWFGAPVERKRRLKCLWVRLPFRPLLRFLYMYVFRLGFLDGRPGLIYALFKAVQEFHINAKMYEAAQTPSRGAAEAPICTSTADERPVPRARRPHQPR